ncbi:MAG: peptidoglycan-binding protein [Acidimicrobiia bacterium]
MTEVLVEEGQTVEEGAALLAVNGTRRFVLQGLFPPYRDLAPGLSGPDVAQLQEALVRLGYAVGRPGVFDWATERAVRSMFRDRGVKLVIDEEQGGVMIEREWFIFVPELPSQVATSGLRIGVDLRNAALPLLTLSNGDLRAVAVVDTGLISDLTPGRVVEIASGSTSFKAEVVALIPASVAEATSSTIVMEFLDEPPADWRGLNVRVTAVFERSPGPVLAVPVSAIYADASTQSYVRRVGPDGRQERIDVEVGATASGYIQIEAVGGSLKAGDMVEVGNKG